MGEAAGVRAQAHLEVLADALVHANLARLTRVVGEDDAHSVLAALALNEYSVAAEKLQLLHGSEVERNDRIIICVVRSQEGGTISARVALARQQLQVYMCVCVCARGGGTWGYTESLGWVGR